MGVKVVRTEGFVHLYDGLSAALLRQATYSTVRFGTYDMLKEQLGVGNDCALRACPANRAPFLFETRPDARVL